MQEPTRQELYRAFIEYVGNDAQTERTRSHRRLFTAVLWGFLLPVAASATILLLAKLSILPRSFRGYAGWIILVFPVLYSLYVLSSEVLAEIPLAFRRGGIATTLSQSVRDGEWRNRVCDGLLRAVKAAPEDWRWIVTSFQIDLNNLRNRSRYLTALAGAVFFLIMQGIDSLTDPEPIIDSAANGGGDASQWVGLALFLALVYLSGNQTYQSLKRYLNCAELIVFESAKERRRQSPS